MTERVKKHWFSLSIRARFLLVLLIGVMLIVVPIVAIAGTGITFSNFMPSNGTTTSSANPTISVKASVGSGTINSEDASMTVDGVSVNPSFDSSTGIISYTPTEKLTDQNHSVVVGVYDTVAGNKTSSNWSFKVDAVPNPSNWKPAKGSTIRLSNPVISLYVKDITDSLDLNSVSATLDGNPVEASLKLKGYTDYDYDTGDPVWVVQSQKEGTITLTTPVLKDGIHNITINVADIYGNVLEEKWSFTVSEGPTFSNILPADQSEQVAVDKISVVITDNEAVDWSTVKLLINGKSVTPLEMDQNNNTITYNQNFSTGVYKATWQAKDKNGILSTKAWSFIADSSAPQIKYLYDFDPSQTNTSGNLKLRLGLTDTVNIKNNVLMKLDDNPLNISFRYKGEENYDGDYEVTSMKEAYIEYEGGVANGNHTLSLYAEDKLGNQKTYTWDFVVSSKPVISEETPLKYGVTDLTPTISAIVKSNNGNIKAESIVLIVDGVQVDHTYDANTGKVAYTPTSPLTNENYHEVSLSVVDGTDLVVTRTWKFYTSTFKDMLDSNLNSCTSCHALKSFTGSNGNFEEIHANKLSFSGTHSWSNNRCSNCHTYISEPAGCAQCHGTDDFPYAPHGSTPDINYTVTNNQQYFPLRVTTNRETWDCIICHQPGTGTKGYVGYEAKPSRLLNNHDIPELHKTTTPGFEDCSQCHAQSLTREHAQEGRVDKEGQAITCNTCHQDENLKPVIDAGKTDCASCHANADHKELHTYAPLNSSCTTCHSNVLTEEHNKIQSFSCANCHESAGNPNYSVGFKRSITTALAWSQKSCSECHSGDSTHGVTFAKTVPKDLKYGSADWMTPESLDFWEGESWVPKDMAGGLYTMTKRKADLLGTDVFNYYQEKMNELGWNKVEGPDSGSNKFQLVYTKGNAKVIIRFFDTEHYPSSISLDAGYRIEILYK